jgi:hypothetical protein
LKKIEAMKKNSERTEKKVYSSPQIERVTLDNEISLTMESSSPADPPVWTKNQDNSNHDPFKTNMG